MGDKIRNYKLLTQADGSSIIVSDFSPVMSMDVEVLGGNEVIDTQHVQLTPEDALNLQAKAKDNILDFDIMSGKITLTPKHSEKDPHKVKTPNSKTDTKDKN